MRLFPRRRPPAPSVPLDSPCVEVCALDPDTRLCCGCFRSPGEIVNWNKLTLAERQQILAELPERRGRAAIA